MGLNFSDSGTVLADVNTLLGCSMKNPPSLIPNYFMVCSTKKVRIEKKRIEMEEEEEE